MDNSFTKAGLFSRCLLWTPKETDVSLAFIMYRDIMQDAANIVIDVELPSSPGSLQASSMQWC